MLEWAKFFQTPKYLDLYRKITMVDDYKPIVANWIGLQDSMSILDVGCGTGAFCFYLSTETKNSTFTGIDIDPIFIAEAQKKTIDTSENQFKFLVGDALKLPFSDNSFDLVVSYTVLTNLPNGSEAIKEMIRVLKPGGSVVSVTTQSLQYLPNFEGIYSLSQNRYYPEYKYYMEKVNKIYETIQPYNEYLQYGTSPEKIPLLFSKSDLKNIKAYPLSYIFSLSNAIYTKKQKEEFIQDMYCAEIEKLHNYVQLPTMKEYLSSSETQRYEELLDEHRKSLLKHINENRVWQWFGGAQILITGEKLGNSRETK